MEIKNEKEFLEMCYDWYLLKLENKRQYSVTYFSKSNNKRKDKINKEFLARLKRL